MCAFFARILALADNQCRFIFTMNEWRMIIIIIIIAVFCEHGAPYSTVANGHNDLSQFFTYYAACIGPSLFTQYVMNHHNWFIAGRKLNFVEEYLSLISTYLLYACPTNRSIFRHLYSIRWSSVAIDRKWIHIIVQKKKKTTSMYKYCGCGLDSVDAKI